MPHFQIYCLFSAQILHMMMRYPKSIVLLFYCLSVLMGSIRISTENQLHFMYVIVVGVFVVNKLIFFFSFFQLQILLAMAIWLWSEGINYGIHWRHHLLHRQSTANRIPEATWIEWRQLWWTTREINYTHLRAKRTPHFLIFVHFVWRRSFSVLYSKYGLHKS